MNVTYLIGAGASAQAIPTVKEFNNRFIIFIELLIQKQDITITNSNLNNFYKTVIKEVPTHYSVDTYARKLYFQDPRKYEAFKTLLSFYFLFEQSRGSEALLNDIKLVNKEDVTKHLSLKKDPRYDAFFATLINKDTRRLSNNISVISWNYDLQFELAFAEFLDIDIKAAFNNLATYPCPSSVDAAYIRQARFLKLNGIAGIYYDFTKVASRDSAYKLWIDPKSGIFNQDSLNDCNLWVDASLNSNKIHESLLQYAWDEAQEIEHARKRATNLIYETDSLIIIGYSFPNYNRAIDKQIFSQFNHLKIKEIRLQVSNDDFEACNERFRSCLPMKLHQDFVQKVHYRDLFYIDNSLL